MNIINQVKPSSCVLLQLLEGGADCKKKSCCKKYKKGSACKKCPKH